MAELPLSFDVGSGRENTKETAFLGFGKANSEQFSNLAVKTTFQYSSADGINTAPHSNNQKPHNEAGNESGCGSINTDVLSVHEVACISLNVSY